MHENKSCSPYHLLLNKLLSKFLGFPESVKKKGRKSESRNTKQIRHISLHSVWEMRPTGCVFFDFHCCFHSIES